MSTKLCDRCKRRLKADAMSCVCGWSASGATDFAPRAVIACCFSNCAEGAICRVFTPTGWANVCKSHYPKIELSKKSYAPTNQAVLEGRRAYEGSFHYRQKYGGEAPKTNLEERRALESELAGVREKMAAFAGRQPGEDSEEDRPADLPLGIPLDDFERELGERMEP